MNFSNIYSISALADAERFFRKTILVAPTFYLNI